VIAEEKWTENQKYCIEALARWALGRHHLPKVYDFGTGVCVNWYGDLSTFDMDRLTRLVIIAHAYAIRIEIGSSGPRMVRIIAHRRIHDPSADIYNRHPDLNDLQLKIEEAKLKYP